MIKQYYYYNYLFQKSFIEKKIKDAAIATIFTSSLYFYANSISIIMIFAKFYVFGKIVSEYILNNNTWIYYLGTGILVFFFFTCFYRKKYLKIIEEMENIDENQKMFWKKFTIFFKLGTFVIFIVSMIIMHI